jgi:hypothetical protein
LVQLTTSGSLLLLLLAVSVYVSFGKSTRKLAYALVYGEGGRITTKPTLVGHIHLNINIFSQILLGCCDDELNITLMVIVCTSKQINVFNFTKHKGGVIKIQETEPWHVFTI